VTTKNGSEQHDEFIINANLLRASTEKIGISHALPEDTVVVHTTIQGSNSLGRITDLLSAWCKHKLKLSTDFLSGFRLLMQSLVEFSCFQSGEGLGQVEMATHNGFMIVATRFQCKVNLTAGNTSKELTQYWLNAEEIKLFKKMLNPHDYVEVRFHAVLNLIEWRVLRKISESSNMIDHGASFKVLVDSSSEILASPVQFLDLGDLDFEGWLNNAYRNTKTGSRAGSITVAGGESQDEQEWARIVVEREKEAIDQTIETFKADALTEDEVLLAFNSFVDESDNSEWVVTRNLLAEDEIEKVLKENDGLKNTGKEINHRVRKLELLVEREKQIFQRKNAEMESLLRKKEYLNQRHQKEVLELTQKLSKLAEAKDSAKVDHFRVKAIEMYEMLKRCKEDYKSLERVNYDLRKELSSVETTTTTGMSQKYIDELTKKMERFQRALEAEKLKVKTLSDRATVAEKEAQASGPLIDDLESKVEHTLKVVQQHKKETEQVKQKLVQSEAEKNKVKNELMKAQAQIQTLMKRQAA
jgi:hypothetical protein